MLRFKDEKLRQGILKCIVNIYCIIIYNWKILIQRVFDVLDSFSIIFDQFFQKCNVIFIGLGYDFLMRLFIQMYIII